MAVKFLQITPEEAVRNLEDCMNNGYATIEKIRGVHEKQKAITGTTASISSEMHDLYNSWYRETLATLSQIFSSVWRQFYFKEAKTSRYASSGDTVISPFEHDFEAKIKVLKEYYDVVMGDSDPKINIEGDLVFQAGENIKYEKHE